MKKALETIKNTISKVKIKPKKILGLLYWFIFLLVLFVVAGTATSVYNAPAGFRMFVVTSGSMEPALKTGSVVLTMQKEEYFKGDVISFLKNPSDDKRKVDSPITHRIIEKTKENDKTIFTTKGDANKTPDLETVNPDQILGKVILSIPIIGKLLVFAQTQMGFTFLIVIPVVLIIFIEIQKIIKELSNKNNKTLKEEDDKVENITKVKTEKAKK
ncbi:MAG TPA: signal peptidase I [bacterium]|nr:signal peptidase I [bacterium]